MIQEKNYDSYSYNEYFKVDLPDHWVDKRLSYIAKEHWAAFVDGPFGSDLKTSDYKDDGIPLIQLNNIRDSKHLMQNMKFVTEEKKQQLIRHLAIPGDVVIAKMADPVARSAVVSNVFSEYVIVADCVKLSPNLELVDLYYLVWAINSDHVRINAELVSTGTTRIRINLGELKKLKIPYPPYNEQKSIANFLDYEVTKIDTLIEKQQQLIKLLKEKRQAVISHAVTKGLNPNAPMRDSGVEWLGEVPEHWVNCTLRRYADFVDGDRGSEYPNEKDFRNEGVVFLSSKNIVEENLDLTEVKFISQQKFNALNRGKALDGDLIVKVRGSVGRIGELAKFETAEHGYETAFINAQMMIIRTRKGLLTNYLRLVSQSLYWTEQLAVGAYGTAQQQLSNEVFSNLYIVVPPEDEQLLIKDRLEQDLTTFNGLIGKTQKAIALMQERRTALISAAVTGKIDVRKWQAPEFSDNKKTVRK